MGLDKTVGEHMKGSECMGSVLRVQLLKVFWEEREVGSINAFNSLDKVE